MNSPLSPLRLVPALVLLFLARAVLQAAPITITGQSPMKTPEGVGRSISPVELIVDDPDGTFPNDYNLVVLDGENYSHQSNPPAGVVTPVAGFVGTLTVPVKVVTAGKESNVFNLAVAVNPSLQRILHGGRATPEPGGGYRIGFTGNPGETYAIQYSNSLQAGSWHPLATATAGANALFNLVDTPPPGTPQRFYRVALPYENDFNSGAGAVTLLGSAVWVDGAVRLSDEVNDQLGAVVFEGISATPALNGFVARFTLAIGPDVNESPADGVSFAVGDLDEFGWGEIGPLAGTNLVVGFDTYQNGPLTRNRGIHLWVNGEHRAYSLINPFSFGVPMPVEISYSVATGVTVLYNGTSIFNNHATTGFVFPADGKFGIGGRTGGSVETAFVDDVVISPR